MVLSTRTGRFTRDACQRVPVGARVFVQALSRAAALLLFATSIASESLAGQTASSDFFAGSEPLEFTLRADLVALLSDRSQESEERPGEVQYTNPDGSHGVIPVQVKTRGSFRLDPSVCDFPPLRLNFRRRDVPRTPFAGQDQLKMVTHCLSPDTEYQQYVILEYLVYRAYERLTPKSFRTRLARVTYEDMSGTFGAITRYAFMIEDVVDMANRNDAKVVEFEGFHPLLVDEVEMGIVDVFQYMIGNTDWSVVLNQNIEFLEDSLGNVSIVPFDFDWSGAVAPPYAVPAPDVPTRNVQERFYMGVCRTSDHLTSVFQRFQDAREEILSVYRAEETLTAENRERLLAYFDDFFATIADQKKADEKIRNACRL